MWDIEDIPNTEFLYMRINIVWMENGEPTPAAFRVRKGDVGMSTDWARYSTPEQTRDRAKKNPNDNAIIAMEVGAVREIPGQTVRHDPIDEEQEKNRAHTLVIGEKTTEVRAKFLKIYRMILQFPT